MAKEIVEHNHYPFSVTSSSLIAPFLSKEATFKILKSKSDLMDDTFSITLYDTYAISAGVIEMIDNNLKSLDTLAFYPEPTLDAPMVWLESSEYNGWDYQETLDLKSKSGKGFLLLVRH